MLEKFFRLQAHHTNIRTEIIAGFTTFVTMAYILFVNPSVLSISGMDKNAVLLATAIGSGLVTISMGLYANYPVALAPGMDLNSFFVYTIVLGLGVSWQIALGLIFLAGVVFAILAMSKVRQLIVDAVPLSLKYGIVVGIGFFIIIIGLKLSGILAIKVSLLPETLEMLRISQGTGLLKSVESNILIGDFNQLQVALGFLGLVVTSVLVARKVQGAMLISIVTTTIASIITGYISLPTNFSPIAVPDFGRNAFFALDIMEALRQGLFAVIIIIVFVELFNNLGAIIGVAAKANLLEENGDIKGLGKAMLVGALGTSFGALLGTSPITIYSESATGISEGGRTGLTSVVCGLLFLVALIFSPVFLLIPDVATAPVLIVVGFFMIGAVVNIDFENYSEAIPAFMTIVFMPLTYSITNGISIGIVLYPLIKVFCGKRTEVHWMMYLLAGLVILLNYHMN